MSVRPEAQLPFDRNEWINLARGRLRWGASTRVHKICNHEFCHLTQSHCCACIDNRPHAPRYYKYVDGQGMVPEAKRWSDYCPGCKDVYGDAMNTEDQPDREVRVAAVELSPLDCLICGSTGHAFWDCPREVTDQVGNTIGQMHSPTRRRNAFSEYPEPAPSYRDELVGADEETNDGSTPMVLDDPPPTRATFIHPPPLPQRSRYSSPRLTSHQQRRARVQAHFERSFGTLTDIANDPDYVSSIASMYGNAYARFQERERERRERQRQLESENPSPPTNPFPSPSTRDEYSDFLSTRRQRMFSSSDANRFPELPSPAAFNFDPRPRTPQPLPLPPRESNTQQVLEALRRQLEEDDRHILVNSDSDEQHSSATEFQPTSIFGRWYDMRFEPDLSSSVPRWSRREARDVPARPKTPEALSKEELTISNECKVCFSQHCDMLLMPCAHLALCEVIPASSVVLMTVVCKEDVPGYDD